MLVRGRVQVLNLVVKAILGKADPVVLGVSLKKRGGWPSCRMLSAPCNRTFSEALHVPRISESSQTGSLWSG